MHNRIHQYLRRLTAFLLPLAIIPTLTGCAAVPDPAVRFIAFGDSTAAGPAETQYWQILQQDLGEPPEAFAGQGVGGEDTAAGLQRLRDLLEAETFPNAHTLLYWQGGKDVLSFVQRFDPLILLSPLDPDYPYSNQLGDTLDQAQTNIRQAIETAQQAGLDVYVATYYDLSPDTGSCDPALAGVLLPSQAVRVNQYVALLNERIRLAADQTGATLVDVAAIAEEPMADPANYADCRHLSTQGNRIVAGLFARAMGS